MKWSWRDERLLSNISGASNLFREMLEPVSFLFNTYYNCSLVAMSLVIFIVVVIIVVVVRLVAISNAASKFFFFPFQRFCLFLLLLSTWWWHYCCFDIPLTGHADSFILLLPLPFVTHIHTPKHTHLVCE